MTFDLITKLSLAYCGRFKVWVRIDPCGYNISEKKKKEEIRRINDKFFGNKQKQ